MWGETLAGKVADVLQIARVEKVRAMQCVKCPVDSCPLHSEVPLLLTCVFNI